MGFLSVLHSDVGIKKNTNQDSVLIKVAYRLRRGNACRGL